MPGPSTELQKAVHGALLADPDVIALIAGRVYDRRPRDNEFPCLTYGPSDVVREDLTCISLEEVALQLDCWTRAGGTLHLCRTLVDTVAAALHLAKLDLDAHALARLRVDTVRVFQDSDGLTAHGVVTLVAEIERR